MQRRQFFTFAGSLAGLFALPLQLLAKTHRATPTDQEGPFYPVKQIPLRSNLIQGTSLANESVELDGQVLNKQGKPLSGAKVEIWQCDKAGIYDHPNQSNNDRFDSNFSGFGAQLTDVQGYYKFTTLYPAPYPGRPPHIHVKIWNNNQELLTTQLYLEGKQSGGWLGSRREPLQINPKKDSSGKMIAKYTFVV